MFVITATNLEETNISGKTPGERQRRKRQARRDKRQLAARDHHLPNVNLRPKFTIYSDQQPQGTRVELEVPLQVEHTGSGVVSSLAASDPCVDLGIAGLLQRLNDLLGTTYTLDTPSLSEHLQRCIDCAYDFGFAYAYLRPRWYQADFYELKQMLHKCETEDAEMRRCAIDLDKKEVVNPLLPPRRVWDLYSNRVVPMWVIRKTPWAISHSWMNHDDRFPCITPINAQEWPVPIPKDTTLERVRVELLNLDAEYVWLDVLCLRQQGDEDKEPLRLEEWKLDVPTIGNVYHQNQVIVHYYSGLGRPFHIGDLTSDRHWLNRAWTLQEISPNSIIAGIAGDSPVNLAVDNEGWYSDRNANKFYDSLALLAMNSQTIDSIFPVLDLMRHRAAVSELDKIAGLAYLLRSQTLPLFILDQPLEDAWSHLIAVMNGLFRWELLFLYPAPGSGPHSFWHPSWAQIKDTTLPRTSGIFSTEVVEYNRRNNTYCHYGFCLDSCLIEGLEESSPGEDHSPRHGTMTLLDVNGFSHRFSITAFHTYTIPRSDYTIVGNKGLEHWLVCKRATPGTMKKVSVVRMPTLEAQDEISKLGLGNWLNCYYL